MTPAVPDPLEQPLLTAAEAGAILGMGASATHEAIGRGEVPSVRIGRRVLVPTAPLRRLLGIDPPSPTLHEIVGALADLVAQKQTTPAATAEVVKSITPTTNAEEDLRAA